MQKEIKCKTCKTEIIIVENSLFFSEKKTKVEILCPECKSELESKKTDGWFFVQSKLDFLKEIEIEKKKERFIITKP